MNLSVNPYSVIPRPKFGSQQANKDIADQWKEWRSNIRQVHDIYGKLVAKKKSMGAESDSFKSLLGTLRLSPDFIQKNIRDDMTLSKAVPGYVIIEAASRFHVNETCPDFSYCDEKGWTEWEYQILVGK